MNQDKINNFFDKLQKVGHIVINITFIIFLIVVTIISNNFLFALSILPLILIFILHTLKKIGKSNKITEILFDICLFIVIIEILFYIINLK